MKTVRILLYLLSIAGSAATAQNNLPPAPVAPTNVSVANTGGTGVRVTWNAVPNALGYSVYRSTHTATIGSYVGGVDNTNFDDQVPYTPGTFHYRVQAWGAGGTGPRSPYRSISVGNTGGDGSQSASLGDAVEYPSWTYTTGGSSPWLRVQASNTQSGGDAAFSGVIGNGQSTWMETTVTGPLEVSFFWRTESELHGDYLIFTMDGSEVQKRSGYTDWAEVVHRVPAGRHTLRWTYDKDWSTGHYADRGMLDRITVRAGADGGDFESYVTDFQTGYGDWTPEPRYGGWANYWRRDYAGTPSLYTGPYYDHTLGSYSGYYAYLEASYSSAGEEVKLISPEYNTLEGPLAFSFWYHMYGYDTGTLAVDVWQNDQWETRWQRSGIQHYYYTYAWTQAELDLSDLTGITRIRVRAVAAGGHRGDIAIDDLVVIQTILPDVVPDPVDWDLDVPFPFVVGVTQPSEALLVP